MENDQWLFEYDDSVAICPVAALRPDKMLSRRLCYKRNTFAAAAAAVRHILSSATAILADRLHDQLFC